MNQRQRILEDKRTELLEASDRFYAGQPGKTLVRPNQEEVKRLGQASKLGKTMRDLINAGSP